MIVNSSFVQYARDFVSDALFATDYTVLSNEWDLFICNLLVTVILLFTLWLFYKVFAKVISIFGG